ncbi:CYTH domain-containing protein [Alloalcanivorax venustensis]|jgi:CYTH domain-containing protein|uniref:CYTH domain-containing protein n=1 Tax=Alloalcanivorax venustensis TaxID=172371 RepID=UPI00115C7B3E|nr:CYTH domain-containing protein [Pseudomonadota bacterium]SMO93637.1 CYTH domain-containing protein [Alcanivorax sp. DSM 26295]|tara:strand:- start:3869 stop:4333 length:465 start_codon:yes stop_codon:yes gene_type:complete
MAVEIERKFRTKGVDFLANQEGERLTQGYLSHDPRATVRLRVQGDRAWLTIKGKTHGASRSEFEYPIPTADAHAMLEEMCPQGVIDKTRYRIPVGEHVWEVDEFHGDNQGLVVAEVELDSEDQPFERPPWLGEEVTDDPRYYNSALSRTPYGQW